MCRVGGLLAGVGLLLQLGLFLHQGERGLYCSQAPAVSGRAGGLPAAAQGLPFGGATVGALLRRRAALLQLAEFELQLLQALGAGLAVGLVPGTLQAEHRPADRPAPVVSNTPACWKLQLRRRSLDEHHTRLSRACRATAPIAQRHELELAPQLPPRQFGL